jgi:signal transduction histidine kinase
VSPHPGPRRRGLRPLTTRVALLAGFGGLLGLLALSGLDAVEVLSQIQSRNAAIRRDFLLRSRSLEQIRAMLYLSGTYVRDYLLEPDPAKAEGFRVSLADTRRQIEAQLAAYDQLPAAGERQPLRSLRQELSAYWRSLDPVLGWSPRQRREQGYSFLRDVVFPRRMGMLNLADRIAAVNEGQLDASAQRLAELFSSFRRRLGLTLAATLGLGLLLAAASVRHILRLEGETARHLVDLDQARSEQKELSARLVAAQETERKALSRELHDAVGQSLSAVLMELRNLTAMLPPQLPELGAHAATIRRLVEGAVDMVRNMALVLRPSMLDDLGLVAALQWQARETGRRTGMLVHVAAEELPEDLPDEHRTCIYRVVQEALTNCARHSGARSVSITLRREDGGIGLAVQDDGHGFRAAQEKGLGLLGIQERVNHLGGSLRLASEPGRGTLLVIELPLPAAPAAPAAVGRVVGG